MNIFSNFDKQNFDQTNIY